MISVKNNNLFIANGRFGSDKAVGNFTFRNTSVLDYCIVSSHMFEFYKEFEIIEMDPLFCDGHSLLRSVLKFESIYSHEEPSPPCQSTKPKWIPENTNDFIHNIDNVKINSLIQSLENNNTSKIIINDVTNGIGEIFDTATTRTFPVHKYWNKSQCKGSNKPWFGSHCKVARRKYHIAKKKYNLHKTVENRRFLRTMSKEYKCTMNRYINKYKHDREYK